MAPVSLLTMATSKAEEHGAVVEVDGEHLIVNRKALRMAAAISGLSDLTVVRLLAGFPSRGDNLRKLADAFAQINMPRVSGHLRAREEARVATLSNRRVRDDGAAERG
jgi:hypothetical protein